MLINLVGDLHQWLVLNATLSFVRNDFLIDFLVSDVDPTRPLHVGYANDNSGRKILVKFRGGDLRFFRVKVDIESEKFLHQMGAVSLLSSHVTWQRPR